MIFFNLVSFLDQELNVNKMLKVKPPRNTQYKNADPKTTWKKRYRKIESIRLQIKVPTGIKRR